jgi:ABC-type branched-subunit amino acid transport system permease subunit
MRPPALGRRLALTAIVAIALAALSTRLGAFTDFEIGTGAAYLCAASGLTMLTGLGRQLSLGQGAMMAVGAYAFALTQNALAGSGAAAQWTVPVAAAAGVAAAAAVGMIIGLTAIRVRGAYLAGLTLVLAVAVPAAAAQFPVFNGDQGLQLTLPGVPAFLGQQFSYETWQTWEALAAALVVMVVLTGLVGGRFGRTLRALGDNEVAGQLCGISAARHQATAFVLSAACAGLGGCVVALLSQSVTADTFSLTLSLNLLLAIVVGGVGSLAGAVWGSALLVLLPYLTSTLSGRLAGQGPTAQKLAGNLPLAISGLLLIGVVIAAPGGIQDLLRRAGRRLPGWSQRRPEAATAGAEPPAVAAPKP